MAVYIRRSPIRRLQGGHCFTSRTGSRPAGLPALAETGLNSTSAHTKRTTKTCRRACQCRVIWLEDEVYAAVTGRDTLHNKTLK